MSPEKGLASIRKTVQAQQEKIKFSFPEVNAAAESVVKIVAYAGDKPLGQGSGVLVEGGSVFTAYHVVDGSDTLLLYTHAGGYKLSTTFDGDYITVDEKMDVAMFSLPKVFDGIVPPRKIGLSNGYNEELFLLGYPSLHPKLKGPLYGKEPIIEQFILVMKTDQKLVTIAEEEFTKIFRGASGGALVNKNGEVIGISHSGRSFKNTNGNISHLGFAADINAAIKVLAG